MFTRARIRVLGHRLRNPCALAVPELDQVKDSLQWRLNTPCEAHAPADLRGSCICLEQEPVFRARSHSDSYGPAFRHYTVSLVGPYENFIGARVCVPVLYCRLCLPRRLKSITELEREFKAFGLWVHKGPKPHRLARLGFQRINIKPREELLWLGRPRLGWAWLGSNPDRHAVATR
jgi:hypothetical protein